MTKNESNSGITAVSNPTPDDWPYAEDSVKPGDFTEQFRYPIVHHPYPRWLYITAVVVSDDRQLWQSVRPTDDELRIIGSFHQEYVERWYGASYKAKMRQRPFDIDGGAVGRYLIKRPNGGWGYRLHTWEYGPEFVPDFDEEPTDLVTVLDRYHKRGDDEVSPRWQAWKAAHTDVFPAVAS